MKLFFALIIGAAAVSAAPQKVFTVGNDDQLDQSDAPKGNSPSIPLVSDVAAYKTTADSLRDAQPGRSQEAGRSLGIFNQNANPNRSYFVHVAEPRKAQTLSYENEQDGHGGYKFGFVTSNGISRAEVGELVNPGTDQEFTRVRGVITWFDYEGNEYEMRFIADDNGFHPVGNYLKYRAH